MTQGISLNDYTNSIKAELEALDEVHEAILFCGQITEDTLTILVFSLGIRLFS